MAAYRAQARTSGRLIKKPFAPRELIAREALRRRVNVARDADWVHLGDVRVDLRKAMSSWSKNAGLWSLVKNSWGMCGAEKGRRSHAEIDSTSGILHKTT
jgi:hypothetical protein